MSAFLVSRIWVDPMENLNADGYSPFCICLTEYEAKQQVAKGRLFTETDCWSLRIGGPKTEFIYQELPLPFELN